jgi:hypothetical protein
MPLSIHGFASLCALACRVVCSAQGGPAPTGPSLDADGKVLWHDARLLTIEGRGWTDTEAPYDRLPAKAKGVVRDDVWGLAHQSAGICVRFRTDSPTIRVRWALTGDSLAMPHMPATGVSGVDLYARRADGTWQFAANGRPGGVTNDATFGASGSGEYTLYLPLYNGVRALEIGTAPASPATPVERGPGTPKPIVWYGTSIVQGGCASRPGMAATAIVGRRLNAPVINLGFSGNGLMEPEMADLLAELDPSVYVLDALWNMTPELMSERVAPFVRRLRAAHADTPIALAEDSSVYNAVPTAKGKVLRDIIARLEAEGVAGLHLVSAEGMLGSDGDATVDGCHPNDLGMTRQAEAFERALRPLLPGAPPLR